jgi:hypothetical protein
MANRCAPASWLASSSRNRDSTGSACAIARAFPIVIAILEGHVARSLLA